MQFYARDSLCHFAMGSNRVNTVPQESVRPSVPLEDPANTMRLGDESERRVVASSINAFRFLEGSTSVRLEARSETSLDRIAPSSLLSLLTMVLFVVFCLQSRTIFRCVPDA